MKFITDNLKQISKLFGLLLLIYILIRFLFLIFNYSIFSGMSWSDIFSAFFFGLRYDISAILYTNVILFILLLLPFTFKQAAGYQKTIRALFIAINLFAFLIAFTDFAYFQYNLKRIDVEVFGLLHSTDALLWDFIKDFWLIFLLFGALIWRFWKLSLKTFKILPRAQFRPWVESATFIFLLPIFVVGMRGGITNKRPLRVVDSSNYVPVKYTPLVTNSVFTFITSLNGRILEEKHFFTDEGVDAFYPVEQTNSGNLEKPKMNVVILILESFSKQYVGKLSGEPTYTPFLDQLIDSSLVCTNAYANGRRSSQGLVALTSGLPALMDEPLMYSKYVNNKIYGLGSILQDNGYETSFYNGSEKYLLGWESYIKAAGFTKNVGKEDYPENPTHHDKSWGIYDHYFYQYYVKELTKTPEPFGSVFFSISSHHPFKIPPEYQDRFNKHSDFLNSLEYADFALGTFFEEASKQPWFENTLFVLSADHTYGADWNDGESVTDKYKTRKGLYEIPILFYHPGMPELRGQIDHVVQQTDVVPSLMDFMGLQGNYVAFGHSVFSPSNKPKIAFQYLNGVYQIISDKYLLMFDGDKAISLYDTQSDDLLLNNILKDHPDIEKELSDLLKAVIQQHNNRMIRNDLINDLNL